MYTIALVVGTRPNIIKITQFREEIEKHPTISLNIIHSNQHYSDSVSTDLFKQLNVKVDSYLPKFEGDSTAHLGFIISELSIEISKIKPDLVIAVGDVNTTLAAAIVANKLGIKLAHLEAGLRSFDREMPEEINRILVDELADYFFVTEKSGMDNLLKDGKNPNSIFFVGNTMIDTLVKFRNHIQEKELPFTYSTSDKILAITLHRPSNVDNYDGLIQVLQLLSELSKSYKIVFPIHPRTLKQIVNLGLEDRFKEINNLQIIEPLDYLTFQKLVSVSYCVITDSGGVQEETTFLKIPCITLRKNTERPVTLTEGTNILMNFEIDKIKDYLENLKFKKESSLPEKWDGNATQRIVSIISNLI